MWPARQFSVLVAAVAVLSACSSSGPTVVPPTRPASLPAKPSPTASLPSNAATAQPTQPPKAKPDLSAFYDQKVDWKNCGSADCAKITVPIDYSQPDGATIELSAARVKATGDRIGTLFVEPGGPGGSAVDYAKAADAIVSDTIRKHFDIVGVDPRGVALSAPVKCLSDGLQDELYAVDGTPDDAVEEQQIITDSADIAKSCEKNGGLLYQHMGTVDVARDYDIARAVVNDETFNYLGKSYGTMIGATYAQLFPDRVGRMVLDGVLPASLDLAQVTKEQAESFEVALQDFVRDCLTHDDCPLTGSQDEAVTQLQQWLASLDAKPLTGGNRPLNEALAAYTVLSYLYFPSNDYPALRSALSSAMKDKDPNEMLGLLDARISRAPNGHYTDNALSAYYAVTCIDRPFNGTVTDVKTYAKEWAATAPTFGPSLAWSLLTCKDWPVIGDRVTTTTADGSNPILVLSTTHDPATPYQWGKDLAAALDNGHLLTYDGYGHTAYRPGRDCVVEVTDAYLVSGKLPADDTVCP